jgi:aromatic ring-opening dioxygenase catalytic subunit (LigB family)
MTIAFACALGHAPGIVAWSEAAPPAQREALEAGFTRLRGELAAARVDELILFTSEHWANFFLDHISAFCVGRAEHFDGPVEPWLKIDPVSVPGAPDTAERLLLACYEAGIEPGFTYEMKFDHGTIVPLHYLTPQMDVPVVPIVINTLAPPQPSSRRCLELGRVVGEFARASDRRIGLVATGGMSHDPGELRHGWIDQAFDRRFLDDLSTGDLDRITRYSVADLAAAGAGAIELLGWIALAGALGSYTGEVIAYEAVEPWATGIGLMRFAPKDQRAA